MRLILINLLCLFLAVIPAAAADCMPLGHKTLSDKYHKIEENLHQSTLGMPVHIESSSEKNDSQGDIYGIIRYPFDVVEHELSNPANWCDIALLHLNVRGCSTENLADHPLLTVYNVNRYSQSMDKAYALKFEYRVDARAPGYFDILLVAPEGPFSTKDHRFNIEAMPIEEGSTLIHLRYSYKYSVLSYFVMKSYFSTFGSKKVGFTTAGAAGEGRPVYIGGLRGAVERNIMRYYLAIITWLDTPKSPAEQRFENQISRWYDLTALYKRQLAEAGKEEYLALKREDKKRRLRNPALCEKYRSTEVNASFHLR